MSEVKKGFSNDYLAIGGETVSTTRKPTPKKKKANSLDGRTWTRYSISVWSDIQKNREEKSLGHPAMFPVELPRRLIQIFTHSKGQMVLDPFSGVGSTLVAAEHLGVNCVGMEISPKYCDITLDRLRQTGLFDKGGPAVEIHNADARQLLNFVAPNTVDLVITSPPYWDILIEKRTADYKPQRDYGDDERDLGRIRQYDKFLDALSMIFADVYVTMKKKSYCCVVVMDLRKKNLFYPYHSDLACSLERVGFRLDDIIIWDRRHEYNNMRPLGYPYVFRVNKAHEYVLIFAKD